ncbi:phage family protein (plasmid) [Rhizobium etli bv. mimosae str. IE4771]|uniref:Phage family protein n=1 Tax=Rhizobium etli bv. mimosae str. IE4771 TaxID=1432050 RepID=A0A060ICT2_RHIET|nr:hypothetical protein [Rhizobium sp. IE4771]AIC29516.1 phage family protein [Rhizobium sp. IE4771]
MSKLHTIFPEYGVRAAIPEATFTSLGMKNLSSIATLKPQTMFELGVTTWHAAMMSRQFSVAPNALGDLVDRREPHLLKHVSRALNRKVLFDLSYQFASVPGADTIQPKVQVLVAHTYPNRIHIADVQLLDPRKPKAGAAADDDQSHESLRLLGPTIENAVKAAHDTDADQVTLTAANRGLVAVFGRYGFAVERSQFAEQAMAVGFGIPMQMDL